MTRRFVFLAVVLAFAVVTGAVIRTGQAATFQGPTNAPPQGNIPVTIWNRVATGSQQTNAAIDIDGGGPGPGTVTGLSVGKPTLDLGNLAGGQNVIYAVADPTKMASTDYLMLLEAPSGTARFSLNKDGEVKVNSAVSVNNGMVLTANSLTNGAGLIVQTSSNVFNGGGSSLFLSQMTGNYAATASTGAEAGVFNRQLSATGAATTLTTTNPVLEVRNGCSALSGATCASNGSVLSAVQGLASASGPVIDITNNGTGPDIRGAAGVWSVSKAGDLTANNVSASACFGPVFQGKTALSYTGNLNGGGSGYVNANALCVSGFGAGAHVCSTAEILNSIKCSTGSSPVRTQAVKTDAWIQDGPPGFTAPANDCRGWTSVGSGDLGRLWRFNDTDPVATVTGRGFLTTCNQAIPLSCCK